VVKTAGRTLEQLQQQGDQLRHIQGTAVEVQPVVGVVS